MTVDLTRNTIPNGVRILSFVPGEILRVRVSLPIMTMVILFVFSLVFYLVFAQVVSFVLGDIFGSNQLVSFGCNATAILVCVLMNIRGAVLTIFFAESRYRLSSPVSVVVRNEVPKVEAATTSRTGRWTSTLLIAGQPIATNTSEISAADAERPFAPFIAAFSRAPTAPAGDQSARSPATEEESRWTPSREQTLPTAPRPGRSHERPMVILVHGTWGQRSTWAFPDRSHLVSALKSRLTFDVEYKRFCWSGANRTAARIEAAKRLAAMIRSEVIEHDRIIIVLAHSHGGNIALRAIDDLPDQWDVRAVLMATPFLWSGQRFAVRDVYKAMPHLVQQNMFGFCMFGFWIGALVLIGGLQRYLPADIRIDILRGHGEISLWQLPLLLLYFFGPFFLFNAIWRKGAASLNALQRENTGHEQKEAFRAPSRLLTIAYNQDEAFQVLSLLINTLGLVHQIAFLLVLGIARLASRTKLLDLIWKGGWIVFEILLLFAGLSIAMTMILSPLAGIWAPIDWLLQTAASIAKRVDSATDIDAQVIFLTLVGVGLVVVTIACSMLIIGAVRIGIFAAIGVMDQIRSQEGFLNAILGTIAISVVPQGESETLLLPGRALFNHVKIYDDDKTIDRIANFIQTSVRADPRTQ